LIGELSLIVELRLLIEPIADHESTVTNNQSSKIE